MSHEVLLFCAGWLLLMAGSGLVVLAVDISLHDE